MTTICDLKCFECIHPDCINDMPDTEMIRLSRKLDKEARCQCNPELARRMRHEKNYREKNIAFMREKAKAYYHAHKTPETAQKRHERYMYDRERYLDHQCRYNVAHRDEINAAKRRRYAQMRAEGRETGVNASDFCGTE